MPFQFHEVYIPPQCAGGIIGRGGSNIKNLVKKVLDQHHDCKIRMKVNGCGRNTNVTLSCVDSNSNAIPFAENLIRNEILRIQDEMKVSAQKKRMWKSRQSRQPRVVHLAEAKGTCKRRNMFEELDFDEDIVATTDTDSAVATPVSRKVKVKSSDLGFNYGRIRELRHQRQQDVVTKRHMEIQGGDVVEGSFQPRKLTWDEFHQEKSKSKSKSKSTTTSKSVQQVPDTVSVSEFPAVSEKVVTRNASWNVTTNCSWDEPVVAKTTKVRWADICDELSDNDE